MGGKSQTIYFRWLQEKKGERRWLAETVLVPFGAFKAGPSSESDCLTALRNELQAELYEMHLRAAAAVDCKKLNNFKELVKARNSEFAASYNANQTNETRVSEFYLPTAAVFTDLDGLLRTTSSELIDFVRGRSLGENITFTTSNLKVTPADE